VCYNSHSIEMSTLRVRGVGYARLFCRSCLNRVLYA